MDENLYILLFVVIGLCIVLYFSWRVALPSHEIVEPEKKYDNITLSTKEHFTPTQVVSQELGTPQELFSIYNFLLKTIRVTFSKRYGDTYIPHNAANPNGIVIPPRSMKKLGRKFFEEYFANGNRVHIHISDDLKPGLGEMLYGEYDLDTPGAFIKFFNVGMITARYVGGSADRSYRPPNAVDGMMYIKIHNMTNNFITLNGNINIGPKGKLRYTGRDHYGVRLGTVFKDTAGIHPDYIFTGRFTDIYYGVTSDVLQPLAGGFQLFDDYDDEPMGLRYPLEFGDPGMGGGPAKPSIDPNYLPYLGPEVPPKDRWGR